MAIKLTIIYKHTLWGDALHALLCRNDTFHVSHMINISDVGALVNKINTIVLLEATYPNAELVKLLDQLKKKEFKVIVVGYHLDNEFLDLLLEKGLDAYVLKTCGKTNLFEAIGNVHAGKKYFCAPITESLSKRLSHKEQGGVLTIREKEVLLGLVCLSSTQQIAKDLNISSATVRTHRKNIMRKFGTRNYFGLLRYACRAGLLQTPDEQFCVGCKNRKCNYTPIG